MLLAGIQEFKTLDKYLVVHQKAVLSWRWQMTCYKRKGRKDAEDAKKIEIIIFNFLKRVGEVA